MPTQVMNIEMERGDTITIRGFLTDENDSPIDDPTASYQLTVRALRNAADPPLIMKTAEQYEAGEGRCTLAPADTSGFGYDRVLFYDMQVTETSGIVTTLVKGKLTVLADVTR